jgi:hypothetical protein
MCLKHIECLQKPLGCPAFMHGCSLTLAAALLTLSLLSQLCYLSRCDSSCCLLVLHIVSSGVSSCAGMRVLQVSAGSEQELQESSMCIRFQHTLLHLRWHEMCEM